MDNFVRIPLDSFYSRVDTYLMNTAQFRNLRQGQIVKVTTKTIGRSRKSLTRYGEVEYVRDLDSMVLVVFRQQLKRDYGFCDTLRTFVVTSGPFTTALEVVA